MANRKQSPKVKAMQRKMKGCALDWKKLKARKGKAAGNYKKFIASCLKEE